MSEYDSVNHGSSTRSVTSVAARVKVDSQQPKPPTKSGSCAIMRWAASLAFSALSWVSYSISFSLAPPIDLLPGAHLFQDALPRPRAGQRHQHGDFYLCRRLCSGAPCADGGGGGKAEAYG